MATRVVVGRREYKSFAAAVRAEMGLTKEEYIKEYDVFKHRVRNYVQATGDKISAAKEFFFYKMQQSKHQRNLELLQQGKQPIPVKFSHLSTIISQTSAATRSRGIVSARDIELASAQIQYRFAAMAEHNLTAKDVMEKLKRGDLTPKQAKEEFDKISKMMKEYKTNQPDVYASDAIVGSP